MSNFKIGDKARVIWDTNRHTGETIYKNCKILDCKFTGNGAEYKVVIEGFTGSEQIHGDYIRPDASPKSKEVSWDE